MNRPVKDIVLDILNIAHYKNDKEKFIDEFLSANYVDALISISDKFPDAIKQKPGVGDDNFTGFTPEDVAELKKYVSDEDFIKELDRITKEEIHKMVEPLLPALNDEQKQQIATVLKSLDETPEASTTPATQSAPVTTPTTQEATPTPIAPETTQATQETAPTAPETTQAAETAPDSQENPTA